MGQRWRLSQACPLRAGVTIVPQQSLGVQSDAQRQKQELFLAPAKSNEKLPPLDPHPGTLSVFVQGPMDIPRPPQAQGPGLPHTNATPLLSLQHIQLLH